ncbi:hypothetical protein J5N97_018747 [Dioscorea zingiberensis]|uniref:Uncharacterized protein n=1 Tax=Dioscorea zingiberensis TaxID=325984 RepID=A0A9D5HC75_9LILI|nr:hypothetical protein J5N97_018747 [Dioscorea zingiberensis]
MSLGSGPEPLYQDSIAIGSFAAMKTGIVPVAAAGNNGTFKSMLSNDAPWILTVGASSTDRRMRAVVKLGNGEKYYGESAYQPDTSDTQLPLVYPGIKKTQETLSCQAGSMQGFDVKGKIVLCGTGHTDNTEKGEVVKKAGGAGMIVMNQPWQGNTTNADAHVIPTSHVSFKDAWDILTYFESTANPTASITFEGTKFGAPLSPAVSDFSSRGPSLINSGIIKPDIVAPGVNVLAAWPFQLGPNPSPTTPTSKTFRFASGTSMATPHVAGIVALLKNSHPKWSPAAIKSALMTTAYVKDREGKPIADQADGVATAFAMGSGHIDPVAADDPGLIYDLQYYDYVHYLCGIGYTDKQVSAIIRGTEQCSQVKKIGAEQLNYPSFLVSLTSSSPTVTVTRTVTNVGDAQETYSLDYKEPQDVSMVVTPLTLKFSKVDEKMSYSVTFSFKGNPPAKGLFSEGYLSWVSGKHAVRSPVVATFT